MTRTWTSRIIGWIVGVPTAAVLVLDGYLAVLTLAAAWSKRQRGVDRPAEPRHRFAVLVPAHDEQANIAATIESIRAQDHPAELVGIHVVADNCTDRTASIAARLGADVHERADLASAGKGPALEWLVGRLSSRGDRFDAAVIIDADTSMAGGFLREMDRALAHDGATSVWQGHYAVRDADRSSSTALRAAALALRHYVRPLGRTALGGSCGLFGNGMVLRSDVVMRRRFSAHLTEDVELQLELLLDDELVGFVPAAVVAAEMPESFEAARTQNERWELGRLQLARTFVPRLLRRAAGPRPTNRVALVDAALDQLVPPLSVLAAASGAVLGSAIGVRALGRANGRPIAVTAASAAVVALMAHVVGGLRLAGVPRTVYVSLLHAPRLVVWKIALWMRVLRRPDDVGWVRTARNEAADGAIGVAR